VVGDRQSYHPLWLNLTGHDQICHLGIHVADVMRIPPRSRHADESGWSGFKGGVTEMTVFESKCAWNTLTTIGLNLFL
jgi:hypothetical protein